MPFPAVTTPLLPPDGEKIGEVTSGGKSPSLGVGIGMGYIQKDYAQPGTTICIEVRGTLYEAITQRPPFLKKKVIDYETGY